VLFFWGEGCPHCEQAKPFIRSLDQTPNVEVEQIEVRRNPEGRRRFFTIIERLGVEGAGIPTFVIGDEAIIGFHPGVTEGQIRAALARARGEAATTSGPGAVDLPLIGRVDTASLPLPLLTMLIGLVDGINPCAMYVLVVLLGLLLHVRSRRRLILYGATFVVMSGIVYFLFMTAWLNVFLFAGVSRWVTIILGALLVGMGLINIKEVFWFKKGISLMVPDKAKPRLFRRMRGVTSAASLPAAFLGIAVLAFLVNLVELGCTLGLPAIYTRVLSLREELSAAARYGYLALYNVAYVVPLALIVLLFAFTMRRLVMTERRAKILKAVSGSILVVFGLVFIAAPELLQ